MTCCKHCLKLIWLSAVVLELLCHGMCAAADLDRRSGKFFNDQRFRPLLQKSQRMKAEHRFSCALRNVHDNERKGEVQQISKLILRGGEDDSDDNHGPNPSSPPLMTNYSAVMNAHETDWSKLDKDRIFEGLKNLYQKRVKPLEDASWYSHFATGSSMVASDFDAKPIVLLIGQYSVGKTSFIRALLGRDFPGMRIGPEPTTDRFVAVMHNEDERCVPGHALSMQKDTPFHGLAQFGNCFLNKFMGANCNAPILRNITLIDTPGVLSGEKQRSGRDYDFSAISEWFAERSDLIIVMFDAHKLDISDELTAVLDRLRPHQDKIRILLNKVQQIDTQQLMRVYGALMWSLGKVLNTPEVPRVYMGSFWDQDDASNNEEWKSRAHSDLLEKEKMDLVKELSALPQNSIMRRISELVKRARAVRVHAFIIHYLRKQISGWGYITVWNKAEKQAELVANLEREFVMCARRYDLPLGDFPNAAKMRASLREITNLRDIPRLDKGLVADMDRMFTNDIPRLLDSAAPRRGLALD